MAIDFDEQDTSPDSNDTDLKLDGLDEFYDSKKSSNSDTTQDPREMLLSAERPQDEHGDSNGVPSEDQLQRQGQEEPLPDFMREALPPDPKSSSDQPNADDRAGDSQRDSSFTPDGQGQTNSDRSDVVLDSDLSDEPYRPPTQSTSVPPIHVNTPQAEPSYFPFVAMTIAILVTAAIGWMIFRRRRMSQQPPATPVPTTPPSSGNKQSMSEWAAGLADPGDVASANANEETETPQDLEPETPAFAHTTIEQANAELASENDIVDQPAEHESELQSTIAHLSDDDSATTVDEVVEPVESPIEKQTAQTGVPEWTTWKKQAPEQDDTAPTTSGNDWQTVPPPPPHTAAVAGFAADSHTPMDPPAHITPATASQPHPLEREVERLRLDLERALEIRRATRDELQLAREELAHLRSTPTLDPAEAERLRQQVLRLEQESHQNYATTDGLTKQRDHAQGQLATLRADFQRIESELETARQECAELREQAANQIEQPVDPDWTTERQQLTDDRDQLATERDQLIQQRDQLRDDFNKSVMAIEQLTQTRNELTEERDRLAAEKSQLDAAVSTEMQTELDSLRRERDQLAIDVSHLQSDSETITAHRDEALETRDQAIRDREALQSELASVSEQLTAAQQELQEHHSTTSADENHVDTQQLDAAIADRDRLSDQCVALQATIDERESTVKQLQQELDTAHDTIAAHEQQFLNFDVELSDLRQARDEALAFSRTSETAQQRHQEQVTHLENTIREQSETTQRLIREKEEALGRLYEIKTQYDDVKAQLASAESQVHQIAPLRARVSELEARVQDSAYDPEAAQAEREDMLEQLRAALQRAAGLEANVREYEAELTIAEANASELEALQQEVASNQERFLAISAASQEKEYKLGALQQEFEAITIQLDTERQRFAADQSNLERRIAEFESNQEELAAALATARREKDLTTQQMHQLQSELHSLKQAAEDTQAELNAARTKNKAIVEVAAQQTEQQLTRLSDERDTAIKAWGRAEQRASDLQATIRAHEVALQRMENDNERLARHLEETQSYRSQLESALQVAEQRLTDEWTEHATTDGNETVAALAELATSRQALSGVAREKQQVLDLLDGARAENRKLQITVETQEQQIAALQKAVEAAKLATPPAAPPKDTAQTLQQLERLQNQVNEIGEHRDDVVQALAAAQATISQLKSQSAEELRAAESARDAATARAEHADRAADQARAAAEAAEAASRRSPQSELTKAENRKLKETLQQERTELAALSEALRQREGELLRSRKAKADLEIQLAAFEQATIVGHQETPADSDTGRSPKTTRPKRRTTGTSAKKKAPAKKTPATKTTTRKTPAKKTTSRKTATKKTTTKASSTKKTATTRSTAKSTVSKAKPAKSTVKAKTKASTSTVKKTTRKKPTAATKPRKNSATSRRRK